MSGGAGRPGTGYSCSPETRSGMRVVTIAFRFGAAPEQLRDVGPGLGHLLEVVEHEQDRGAPPISSARRSIDGFVAFSARPSGPGDRRR